MSMFTGAAEGYDRFMGRYSAAVAAGLADLAGVAAGQRVLDVGCGPGSLTGVLAERTGAENVAAIDPAEQFVNACRERHPGVDVRIGGAEDLPWPAATFDAALACLVVGFMADPARGCAEMARVVRPGGVVATCMWDIAGDGMQMLQRFWDAARIVHPDVGGEQSRAGTAEGQLVALLEGAGLVDVTGGTLTAESTYADFDEFWTPFTFGHGPVGQHLAGLDPDDQARVRDACRASLPDGPFTLEGRAWSARGNVPQA